MRLFRIVFVLLLTSFSLAIVPRLHDIQIHTANQSNANVGYNDSNMRTNGEYLVIKKLIRSGDVLFDIGANRGEWSMAVLSMVPTINNIYAFEPIPAIFNILQRTILNKPVEAYQLALSDAVCQRDFLYYSQNEDVSQLSTFYKRPILHDLLGITPMHIIVNCMTLDAFCIQRNIDHIDFLKIDTEGSELAVLKGAQQLLKDKCIDCIQFEYGGTYSDAGITLQEVMTLLTRYGYVLFRVFDKGLIHITDWNNTLENYAYSNYVAIEEKRAYPFTLINNL